MLADTSVLVAAFASWHERHADARNAVAGTDQVIAHAALETFSVLTRLPEPFRAAGGIVTAWLAHHFARGWIVLPALDQARLPEQLVQTGVVGGAVYDALIARTAAHAGAGLLSLDRRAAENYGRCGARVEWL